MLKEEIIQFHRDGMIFRKVNLREKFLRRKNVRMSDNLNFAKAMDELDSGFGRSHQQHCGAKDTGRVPCIR